MRFYLLRSFMLLSILASLSGLMRGQTFNPSQIRPGANGQVLSTVYGVTSWANFVAGVSSITGSSGVNCSPTTGNVNCTNTAPFITNSSAYVQTSPTTSQTVTQPGATDLNVITSGGGKAQYNGSEFCTASNGVCPSGSGTVTSVTFTGDGVVDSSTPSTAVTNSGTVTATIKNQIANTVLAGPVSGGVNAPTFRALVSADIPNNAANTTGTAANLSGTPALPNGTTATTQTALDGSGKLATTLYVDSALKAGIVTANLYAQYQMVDASGTTLPDTSGNGNNATLHASATISGGGLPLSGSSQYIIWPSAIATTVKSVQIFYADPPPAVNVGSDPVGYPAFFCATGNSAHLQLIGSSGILNQDGAAIGIPFLWSYTANSIIVTPLAGTHFLVYNLDATADTAYLDGLPVSFSPSGASSSLFVTDTYQTGYGCAINAGLSAWSPIILYALFYTTELTQQQAAQNYAAISGVLSQRGVATTVRPSLSTVNQRVCVGDSLTFGTPTGLAISPCAASNLTASNDTYQTSIYGLSGQLASNMRAFPQAREDAVFSNNAVKNVLQLWAGTNDVSVASLTPANTYNYLSQWASHVTKQSYKAAVFLSTMISRTGQDTNKNALNTYLRAQNAGVPGSNISMLVDPAALPVLGADGAYSNLTYFQSDGTHLTPTGYTLVGNLRTHAENMFFGSNYANCDPTIITASTYTAADVDGCKQFNTGSNNITYTLYTSIGYTNRIVYACNVSTTGTNSLTITAASGEYINASGTTSIIVPPVTCLGLRSTLVSASAGGNYWTTVGSSAIPESYGFPITSATGGSGTGTVTCLTATCTNLRGSYSVAGGTFTTGNFLTLVWPTTTTAYVCTATMNGGTGFLGIGNDVATATGMNITVGVNPATATVTVNYSCKP